MYNLNQWKNLFCQNVTPVNQLENLKDIEIYIKRDDLNNSIVQGNKLRKLKYNFKYAIENNKDTIVTFGGAWSNHILAVAKSAALCNLKCIGFIRGDELQDQRNRWSSTLLKASEFGMNLVFLDRQEYRLKQHSNQVKKQLLDMTSQVHVIPEGGSNVLALKGVSEVITELIDQVQLPPTHIITACGTGGTAAGLILGVNQLHWDSKVIGIPVLKGAHFLDDDISQFVSNKSLDNWSLYQDYHFGGYAKVTDQLKQFGTEFVSKNHIDLDKIYTVKSFFAAFDLIDKNIIPPKSRVLILHTGGLQGGSITSI
ncbi:MAG: 1-aminocyclopropane-1-carboxylate deaminase/D-cysteine desulfhydrase [Marinicellaceae bacterium]